DSFALNRCAFALRAKGEAGFPALEKLATEKKVKDAQYPYRWAKVERALGHRRYDRRIQLEEGELLARCLGDAAARRELAVELGKDKVSKGLVLMAESVKDVGV